MVSPSSCSANGGVCPSPSTFIKSIPLPPSVVLEKLEYILFPAPLETLVFVSFSTVVYTLLFLTILYIWWANRQFHFKKRQKDGSRLSTIATHQDVLDFRARQRRQREDDSSDSSSLTTEGGGDNEGLGFETLEEEEESDLSDYESDQDEDQRAHTRSDMAKQNMKFLSSFPPEKRQAVKDLTAVVSNMEVFSYLSQEAFVQCLESMEYMDLPENTTLFDQDNLDGSLYAVVDGSVKCQFEFTHSDNVLQFMDDEDDDPEPFISFTAGNGDVVTSLLSMLIGLVRQCQERNHQANKTPIVPPGISVKAIGLAPNTKLVKVPPQCFMGMLDKFPNDVHRIAQTIIARMQRVTLQTVVRCLGLQKEIVQRHPKHARGQAKTKVQPEAWQRLKVALTNYIPEAASPTIKEKVEDDAARVAFANIMGSAVDIKKPEMKTILEQIKAEATVLSLPPSQTLIETGDSQDNMYLVLQGTLDVGMRVMGASTILKQSKRRASVHPNGPRRNIFPQLMASPSGRSSMMAPGGTASLINEGKPARRRHTSKPGMRVNSSGTTNSNTASTTTTSGGSPTFSRIYQAVVGDAVGILSSFTGDASIVTVRNASDWEPALIYKIPKETYQGILGQHPAALTECLASILDRLGSPIICLLDWNTEWMHVQAGQDVVYRGQSCDALYAVLNGRLRASTPGVFVHPRTGNKTDSAMSTGSSPGPPNIPRPQTIEATVSGNSRSSILVRAKENLQNRQRERRLKNKPKVANAPPPPSRRRMNTTGDEAPGEEFGRGAIIGEVEILTGASWPVDIYASRHSELARVPASVLNAIIRMCPRAGLHLARVVASQIQKKNARKNNKLNPYTGGPPMQILGQADSPQRKSVLGGGSTTGEAHNNILPSYGLSLATIAVVPLLEGDFDMDGFCSTLKNTLHYNIAPCALMTKSYARKCLGKEVFRQRNAMHTLKLTRLCGDLEENSRLVVYQADSNYTWWTRLCIQQADCILLVVRAEEAPPKKKVEACLSWAFSALNVKIQLVVLQNSQQKHSEEEDDELEAVNAYETMASSDALNDWSEQRYWIAGHHLIRTPFKKHVHDFKRLCRRVSGRSIGVVLGGGGARGLAHLGVIKALMEAGITVDFVGGTSQGAYIGALFAMSPDDYDGLIKAARQMADSMSSVWEKLRDLTLPLVSFFSGYRFNRGIQRSLGLRRIQDLVCNFFCVSVDLRNNVQVVHTKGVCWRYVRASMTLQSYLPPLSEDGTLLVDGGYMNILPADIMKKQMRARTVIAVDVSDEVILDNYEYGSYLNGWWILWNSWNPFSKTVKIPSMGDISERLAWVGADNQKKKVKEDIDLFLKPPVANYGVLEFDKFDEIVQIGYDHAKPRVENFVRKYPHLVS